MNYQCPTMAEYQEAIKPMKRYHDDLALHYLIPALRREFDEMIEALAAPRADGDPNVQHDALIELGDCVWMITGIFNHFDILLEMYLMLASVPLKPTTEQESLNGMKKEVDAALDAWVKIVRDKAGNPAGRRLELTGHLSNALFHAVALCDLWGTSMGTVMDMNLKKLRRRYNIPV